MKKLLPLICVLAIDCSKVSAQSPASADSNIGISNPIPLYRLDVQTAVDNDGLRLRGTNPGNLRLRLNNMVAAKEYSFLIGGTSSAFGNGNFVITDVSRLDSARFLINGNTGNIAIGGGSANPAEMLTVNGMVQMTGMRLTNNPGVNKLMVSDASGAATWQSANALSLISGSGSFNYVSKWTPNGFTLGNSQLVDDGTYVGVGNVTPQYKLDLGTAQDNDGLRLRSTSAGNLRLRFNNAGTNKEYSLLLGGTASVFGNGNLAITDVTSGDSARLVINSATGNIGIGSNNPNPPQKLTVNGTVLATGLYIPTNAGINKVLTSDSTGFAFWQTPSSGTILGSGTVNYVPRWTPTGTALGNSLLFDDGTNVGLGTGTPGYRFDVVHGGATGMRVTATMGFSVIDIDAPTGDAALRFAKAGVNQWNIRNRPGDDYFEIFELGGGGSRLVIQDATGNVGIGETSLPAYKLDVLHGGATGIRSRSSAGFSVLQIDAADGDAALRFAKAGVNQWTFRSRPSDNSLEFFELGGGGGRMVIQDATGNVGIGETAAPTYKLDVLHGGGTGIRNRSSASFSVIDVDGQNGDAAFRLVKAGTVQWNIRNNPVNDDMQFFEFGGGGERMRIENNTGKVWVNNDFTVLGVKAFTMDHPLDPANKMLVHAAIESNEVLNAYSGNVITNANGKATVQLPDYFEAINKDFRYQLTVIGPFAQAVISKEIKNNQFEIATNQPNTKVSWEVKGVRNDAHMKQHPFVAVEEKADALKGKYIDPAVHGQPESKRVSYDGGMASSVNQLILAAKNKDAAKTIAVGASSVDESIPAAKDNGNRKAVNASNAKKAAVKESTSQD